MPKNDDNLTGIILVWSLHVTSVRLHLYPINAACISAFV